MFDLENEVASEFTIKEGQKTYAAKKREKPSKVKAYVSPRRGSVKLRSQPSWTTSGGMRLKDKTEKSLRKHGQGLTSGKQKFKGGTKEPDGFSPTSQAHIDVFYSSSKKKFGVAPPDIDPLKTCNVYRHDDSRNKR